MDRLRDLYAFLRYLKLLINGITVVCGLALLGLGLWIKCGSPTFVEAIGSFSALMGTVSYICIGVGAVLAVIGFIGYCGALMENRCLIFTFFFIVTNLFVAEIVGTIFVFVYKDKVEHLIRKASKESLLTAYMGPTSLDPISMAWDTVMTQFKCCGLENSTLDFEHSLFSANTGLKYPKTCCVNMTEVACNGIDTSQGMIHPQSCFTKLINVIQDQSIIIGSTAAGIGVMELASMIVSIVLFVTIKSIRGEENS